MPDFNPSAKCCRICFCTKQFLSEQLVIEQSTHTHRNLRTHSEGTKERIGAGVVELRAGDIERLHVHSVRRHEKCLPVCIFLHVQSGRRLASAPPLQHNSRSPRGTQDLLLANRSQKCETRLALHTWKPTSSKKVRELGRLATRLWKAALVSLMRRNFSSTGFCSASKMPLECSEKEGRLPTLCDMLEVLQPRLRADSLHSCTAPWRCCLCT